MLSIAEEVLVLMLEYDTGRAKPKLPDHGLRNAIGGARLMDLALRHRIDTDLDRLFLIDPDRSRNP